MVGLVNFLKQQQYKYLFCFHTIHFEWQIKKQLEIHPRVILYGVHKKLKVHSRLLLSYSGGFPKSYQSIYLSVCLSVIVIIIIYHLSR